MAARPLPLPLWDRKAGKLVDEFIDDAANTYESEPRRSLNPWLESHPLYDWILAAYQNSRLSRRKIAPLIRKHRINTNSSRGRRPDYLIFTSFSIARLSGRSPSQ
jgi:hypothetical protein